MKLYALLPLAVVCLTLACKKNDSSASKTELITSSTWKYDNARIDATGDGVADTDLPPGYVESCDTDNLITFKSDGTGTVDEGATKCDAGDPQTTAFTWSFASNETIINFPGTVFTGITGDVKLVTLTSAKMTLMKQVTVPGVPIPVNIILDLKH